MARAGYVEVKFRVDGDPKRYSAYGKTKAEAEKKAAVKKALMEAGIRESKSNDTVSKWAKTWLRTYKVDVNTRWYSDMEGYIDKVIIPAIGSKRVQDVKPIDLTKMFNSISNKSESYVNKIYLIVNQLFDAAIDNGMATTNPAKKLRNLRSKAPVQRRTITKEERELSIKVANQQPRDGLFIMIMLYCGCRPQEVARLIWSDIDFDNKVLHVKRALKSGGEVGLPKSDAGHRDIPIPEALMPMLLDQRGSRNKRVCTNLHGDDLTKTSIRNLWERFKRRMDIENGAELYRNAIVKSTIADDLTLYCYRHTYCTDLQDAGVPLVVAARLMGHSSMAVTANIYTHSSQESFENARKMIDEHSKKA